MKNLVNMITVFVTVVDLRDDSMKTDTVNIVDSGNKADNTRYVEDLYGDMGYTVTTINFEGEFEVDVTKLECNV